MAEKIIYTKYSNDRSEEFRIMTQIVECDGVKIVRKSATCKKAAPHIRKMIESEKVLTNLFSDTCFRTNKILSSTEKSIDFEFLEGRSFDKILDEHLKNKDWKGFITTIESFFSMLEKIAVAEFHESEATKQVFGVNAFAEGEKAIPYGCIDLIFQNVIVNNDGFLNVIDYEWLLGFPIPVKYLKYRSLLNYLNSTARMQAIREVGNLFERFRISKAEYEHYFLCEISGFQACVKNGNFLSFSQSLLKPIINHDFIEIFYDNGDGFLDAQKEMFYQFPVTIHKCNNMRTVRIDPSQHACIVKNVSINFGGKQIPFATNAWHQDGGTFYFDSMDPQIVVTLPNNDTHDLICDMTVFSLDEETAANIRQTNERLSCVLNSRSWKITKSLRFAARLFRKILRK